ncbi:SusC/RagA family TonB-linked outer membrane protein [Foetidibacter luteolus]|uniref:SusC/RagA family TonB-linked outer membrane protein n=1 Tax=Foetidibacter luteolus TaxID=2608880 RepID=UPI001A99D8C5|nr:TonB-dependent receptor [Foetidibacter luteolus]
MLSTVALAQKKITGKVTHASDNQPIPGATITALGTKIATVAEADGSFSITVPPDVKSLVVSFIGFEEVVVDVTNTTSVTVAMKERAGGLSEVVITGYSSQRKKDIIGAVAVVDVAELKSTPAANLGAQLQGRATGVTVSGSGAPGSPAVVRIRGFQSGGSNEPLYVIDGVPTSDPSNVNPQDVASMQILKDGTSSAIYGTRAANGVVIITTKQGRAGRTEVNYEGYVGVQSVTNNMIPKMLDNQEYVQYLNRSGAGSHPVFGAPGSFSVPDYIVVSSDFKGGVSASDPRANPDLYSLSPLYQILKTSPSGTDWFKEILQKGLMQSHQVTASGGNERATYSLGMNYFDQQGTIVKTNFRRYLVRFNTSFKPTPWLRLGENAQLSYQTRLGGEQRGEGGAWSWAYRMVPYIPVYDIKGGFGGNGVGQSGNGSNPVANLIRDQDDKNITTRLFGNVFAELQPVKWATLKTSFGADIFDNFGKDISRKTYERSENQGTTQLTERTINGIDWTWTNTLTFQKTIADDHDIKLLLGTEAIRRYYKEITAFGQNFDLDNADFISLSNAGTAAGDRNVSQVREDVVTIFSQFGRLDYSFRSKYLLNATLRRDEASVFGIANRAGYFPSVGFGWRLSEETFMKSISWITDFKIRGGYGQVGNISNNGAFNPYSTFRTGPGFGNYDLNGTNTSALLGYRQGTLGNDSTKWETTVSKNIGFDLTILNGKWAFDFNVYQNDTKDLLIPRNRINTEPTVTQPNENIGTMRNTGIEFSVTNRGNITGDLSYDVQVNFSRYKNEVVKLNDAGNPFYYGLDRFSNAIKIDKGLPISTYWGYQVIGFYNTEDDVAKGTKLAGQSAKVGTWRYLDRNGDGNINADDAGVIGNPHPKFQMGFNIGLNYKLFDFSAFFYWNYGNDIYNYTKWYTDMRGFVGGVSDRVLYDSWTSSNTNAKLPLLQEGFNVPGGFVTNESNSYYVEKGSYFRARNLQLGYTIPANVMNKIKLQKARLYIQAQNLFTITNYTGADPDLNVQRAQRNAGSAGDYVLGVDQSGFPNPKQFLFGLNVTF